MSTIKNPLEIYKLLPKTNCGQCYLPSCLAFSAAVVKGDKLLNDCPHLTRDTAVALNDKIDIRAPYDIQLARQVAALQKEIAETELAKACDRTGGRMVTGSLVIKSLGKDFSVDPHGNITSICHTHAGLAIPLLSYILQSRDGEVSGDWVPFRELEGAGPMAPLFNQRCEKNLKKIADTHTDLFEDMITIFSGEHLKTGFSADISLILYPLPKIPLLICYWKPEDDLESELNLFFDATAENFLSIESIFALGTGLVMMFEKIVHKHT